VTSAALIEEADLAAAEVQRVEIQDAKLHYHERTDEIYYIIDGKGKLVLDDEEVEVHKGVVVYVPRGVEAQGGRATDGADRLYPSRRLR